MRLHLLLDVVRRMAPSTILLLLVASLCTVQATPISKIPDSFDINENIIPDEERGDIEGLLPPLQTSVDYYSSSQQEPEVRNSSYIMDTINNVLRLANTEEKDSDSEPSQAEKDFLKQMAQGFASLFGGSLPSDSDDPNRKPMFRLSADGMSLEFSGNDDKDGEVNIREEAPAVTEVEEVEATTVAEEITTEQPMQSDEAQGRSDDSGSDFLRALWDTVRTSLDYAASLIFGSAKPDEKAASAASTTATPSTSGGLVALEEPLSRHRLPAQEFEKGGRDIDALLYGRGIA